MEEIKCKEQYVSETGWFEITEVEDWEIFRAVRNVGVAAGMSCILVVNGNYKWYNYIYNLNNRGVFKYDRL